MSTHGETKSRINSSQFSEDLRRTSTEERAALNVPVVRKLKPPPEIWELVQPVQPNPRRHGRHFSAHLPSSRIMFILLVAVILCVGGYIGVRSGKQIAGSAETKRGDSRKSAGTSDKSTPESNVPAPVVASSDNLTAGVGESEKPKRKASQRSSKSIAAVMKASIPSGASESGSSPEGSEVSLPSSQKTATPLSKTLETGGADSVNSGSTRKSKTSLSPQLIDSPNTSTPRKPKVIQWP